MIQQRLQGDLLVPFTAGQHRRDRPAVALGPQCSLVENPSWLRPSASLAWASPPDGATPAGAGGVLMGAGEGQPVPTPPRP